MAQKKIAIVRPEKCSGKRQQNVQNFRLTFFQQFQVPLSLPKSGLVPQNHKRDIIIEQYGRQKENNPQISHRWSHNGLKIEPILFPTS